MCLLFNRVFSLLLLSDSSTETDVSGFKSQWCSHWILMNSTKWANQTPGECYLLPKTVMKINSHIFIGASCLILFKELERTVNAVLFSQPRRVMVYLGSFARMAQRQHWEENTLIRTCCLFQDFSRANLTFERFHRAKRKNMASSGAVVFVYYYIHSWIFPETFHLYDHLRTSLLFQPGHGFFY